MSNNRPAVSHVSTDLFKMAVLAGDAETVKKFIDTCQDDTVTYKALLEAYEIAKHEHGNIHQRRPILRLLENTTAVKYHLAVSATKNQTAVTLSSSHSLWALKAGQTNAFHSRDLTSVARLKSKL